MKKQSIARAVRGAGLLVPFLAACASFSAQAADSGIWRWKDAQGNLHYSDQPLNAEAVDIHARSPKKFNPDPPAQSPSERKAQADRDAQAAKAAAAAASPPASAVVALTRTANDDAKRACDQSNAAVQQLSQGGRISSVDASGQRSVLTDDQIAARLREAKAAQARWCSAPGQ